MERTSRAKLTGRALALALACAGLEPSVPLLPGSSARARPIVAIENPVRTQRRESKKRGHSIPPMLLPRGLFQPETVVRSSHRNDKDDGLPVGSVARVCFGVMNAEASHDAHLEVVLLRGRGLTDVVGPQGAGLAAFGFKPLIVQSAASLYGATPPA